MAQITVPTHWEAFEEGNAFYTKIVNEAVESLNNGVKPETVILTLLDKNIKFVDSPQGQDADASVKEVQNRIIAFLVELSEPYGYTEEDIVDRWQNSFY